MNNEEQKDLEQEVIDAEIAFEDDMRNLMQACENIKKSSAKLIEEKTNLNMFIQDKIDLANNPN